MSDFFVPLAIQEEIMKRLPTKSLLQFRSVSKTWKSLIDSSKFIADYSVRQTHDNHLLVCYRDDEINYVSIVDDDVQPFPVFPLITTPVPGGLSMPTIIGSSHGLFCMFHRSGKSILVWNPSIRIRKSVSVDVPYVQGYRMVFGFTVCPCTSDPKVVKISYTRLSNLEDNTITCTPWQVEVYTMSSRAWRSIPNINQPRNSIVLWSSQVAIGEVIYWLALDAVHINKMATSRYNMIVSFDTTSHSFMEISLPADTLARPHYLGLSISKLKESLVVIDQGKNNVYDVWMMVEHGVPNSFSKLFTINRPDTSIEGILGFRKNDEPIFLTSTHFNSVHDVYVDELQSEQMSYLGISGPQIFYSATSYMETLLLLND
ncbi:putative F-box domain-containing protein [Helianthus annuus]|nr:putative F-box domain-containing protein [Helianthus annuus]KAJ0727379.1 putative F-box domain-containing protein [Helianthus annuus]KAJ0730177.1 putative F-box domain-containing protein [Helianthus annuus]